MRKNAKSFYNWCQENNKNYYDYWDYDLNDKTPMEVGYSIKDKYYFIKIAFYLDIQNVYY